MRRFAYWLFPTIAIFVAVFIVVFMIQINPNMPIVHDEEHRHEERSIADDHSVGWMAHLHLNDAKEHFYPVNELTIQADDNTSDADVQKYRLLVHLKDSYDFFCLEQELKKTNLSYLLHQEEDQLRVEIDSNDQDTLSNLVAKLKTYQISATLSPL